MEFIVSNLKIFVKRNQLKSAALVFYSDRHITTIRNLKKNICVKSKLQNYLSLISNNLQKLNIFFIIISKKSEKYDLFFYYYFKKKSKNITYCKKKTHW